MAEAIFRYPAGEHHGVAAGALTPGEVVVLGNRVGVVGGLNAKAAGDPVNYQTQGVFEIAMLSTDTGSIGDIVYWDAGNNRLTTTASTHKSAGLLAKAKTSGQTTAYVDLNASVGSATI